LAGDVENRSGYAGGTPTAKGYRALRYLAGSTGPGTLRGMLSLYGALHLSASKLGGAFQLPGSGAEMASSTAVGQLLAGGEVS